MSTFSKILKPYSRKEFLQQFWGQKGILLSAQGQRQFTHLFTWETLNDLLNFHEFDYPTLRLALDGKVLDRVDNDNLLQHCRDGATLIIDRVHKLVPEITHFVANIRAEIGHPVQTNMYCSWPGRQGFKCHYDTHEVFILQVDGQKEWHIFPETFKYPLVDQKSATLSPPTE
ncbi:MAG: cupin, partial [Cyanothece sp. SIO1E1]|nr:cupin [Cyanothece sp. SIO1E1]